MEKEPTDLSIESRDALRLSALLGESFSLPLLMDLGVAPEALDDLFDQGVLVQDGPSQARFVSETLSTSARDNTPWSQKRRWSLKIAEMLEKRREDPERVAPRYLAAQAYAKARSFYIRAAEVQCRKNDYNAALQSLRQAFEIWPPEEDRDLRHRVLKEMARCAVNIGDYESARMAWEEILEMSAESERVAPQIEANRQLAELAAKRGDPLEVKHRLLQAAQLSSQSKDALEESRQWQIYAQFLADRVRLHEAAEACEKALGAARKADDYGLQSEVIALLALVKAMSGKSHDAHQLIEEAIQIAIDHELPDELTVAYRRKANVSEYSCNYSAYLELELEALDRCRLKGESGTEQACVSCLSYAFFRLGRWKQSAEAYRKAIDEMKVEGELLAVATVVKGCVAAFRGERRQASTALGEALRIIGIHGSTVMEFHVHWGRGHLAMLDGDTEEAKMAFDDLMALWRETDDRKDSVPGLLTAAMFFNDQNDASSLAACTDILNTIASENEALETRAACNAVLAEGAWQRGHVDEAIALSRKAVDGYEKQGLPMELAMTRRRLGLMYASAGDAKGAQDQWRRSEGIARDLGMRPLLEVLGRDQISTGVSISIEKQADSGGLTKRQLDVLRLVATGLTNKEAASKLSLSPRTVEMHMASVLDRLNCRARTDAIKKASELGLV